MGYIVYYGDGEINSRREYSYCNSSYFLTDEELTNNGFFDFDDITGQKYCTANEISYDTLDEALKYAVDVIYYQELYESATIFEDNFYSKQVKFVVKLYNTE